MHSRMDWSIENQKRSPKVPSGLDRPHLRVNDSRTSGLAAGASQKLYFEGGGRSQLDRDESRLSVTNCALKILMASKRYSHHSVSCMLLRNADVELKRSRAQTSVEPSGSLNRTTEATSLLHNDDHANFQAFDNFHSFHSNFQVPHLLERESRGIMASQANALHANLDVDYVITYRFHDTRKMVVSRPVVTLMMVLPAKTEASTKFHNLVQALARVGLATEVRNGEHCSLLVFVKIATEERLNTAVYRSRWELSRDRMFSQLTRRQSQGLALWCSGSSAGSRDSNALDRPASVRS